MDEPKARPIYAWNHVLTILLVGLVASNGGQRSSPISIAPARSQVPLGEGGDFTSTTINDTINTSTPDVLVKVTTNLTGHDHVCLVVASAEAELDISNGGQFVFGLNVDTSASTVAGSDRTIELRDNPSVDDDNFEEVSSTHGFTVTSGSHTFYWSARALQGASTVVNASSMTVACFETRA
jgi:hypothetical protein